MLILIIPLLVAVVIGSILVHQTIQATIKAMAIAEAFHCVNGHNEKLASDIAGMIIRAFLDIVILAGSLGMILILLAQEVGKWLSTIL